MTRSSAETNTDSSVARVAGERPPAASKLETNLADTIVAIPAGGLGLRMRHPAARDEGLTQKALLPLPNGEALILRIIRQYREAGFRRFVVLVNHAGAEVEAYLSGGRPWEVEVVTSYDPDPAGSGRTGALVHAMETEAVPMERAVIVHNADCQIIGYPGSFPRDLWQAHEHAYERGRVLATLAAVRGTYHTYTGMTIEDGRVSSVEVEPFIPLPTHTGISVLSPSALRLLRWGLRHRTGNFERDHFPTWAKQYGLAALIIHQDRWIAVDDRKAYQRLCEFVAPEEPLVIITRAMVGFETGGAA
jgi:NDP-sugar pyrophosphorylase family protein